MPHPNSLLTDASIDALVKIREMAQVPVKDSAMIETALTMYVAWLVVQRDMAKEADELRQLTAQLDALRRAAFDE